MYTCAEMTSSEIANLQLVVDAKKKLKLSVLWKKYVINGRQQFHQYQQNEQLPFTSNHWTCRKIVCYPKREKIIPILNI
jgi:hypothetical protein